MNKSLGEQFHNDPRVREAKESLAKVLADYRNRITGVRPGDPALEERYEQWLHDTGRMRGRDLFFPYLGSGLGSGPLVELADGSVKMDFITGIGVHGTGHSHPAMLDAGIDGALEDTVMQGNLQQGPVACAVMELFLQAASGDGSRIAHCFLTSSGAMANENAFKIIFQKNAPASRFLAFRRCFTGRSLATAQMTDKAAYREGLPVTLHVDYVPFYEATRHDESISESVSVLREHLARHPGQYAGMCMELIQGEGGYYPGHREFFTALIEVLKEHHVAVMIDEVQSFGRTSSAFAFQYFGLQPLVDVVTVGKMSQVCATLYSEEYNPRPGLLSQTFTSSSAALHASRRILQDLLGGGYLGPEGTIMRMSERFRDHLRRLASAYPEQVGGPFGLGAMVAFTFADGQKDATVAFLKRLYRNGLMGFVAGGAPVRIRFLPPVMGITDADIDAAAAIIEQTLGEED